jgi:hypothetical protein
MNDTYHHSHLFTLRLWPDLRPNGETAWRAQVTHVLTGETRYFREWGRLIGFLAEMGGLAAARPPVIGQGEAPDTNTDVG